MLGDDVKQHEGWVTIGLLAAAGVAGALVYKKKPFLGSVAGMLAVVALRKPISWA